MYGSTEIAEHMTLFARVENLFDEEYEEVNGYPGLGRAFIVGSITPSDRLIFGTLRADPIEHDLKPLD